jgi:signal transduction histidine kinase
MSDRREWFTLLAAADDALISRLEARMPDIPARIRDDPEAKAQYLAHAKVIYRLIFHDLEHGLTLASPLTIDIARARADQRIHPRDSVRAAVVLHEVIQFLVRELVPAGADRDVFLGEVSTTCLAVLLRIFSTASDAHLEALLSEIADSNAAERRRISRELHDQTGRQDEDIITVQAALDQFVRTSPSAVPVTIVVTGEERRVPPAMRREVFMMIRESLRNAQRHAQASKITVQVDIRATHLWVRTVDDGVGMPQNHRDGSGMTSLRERAALLGAKVEWLAAPDEGTVVLMTVPLPGNE